MLVEPRLQDGTEYPGLTGSPSLVTWQKQAASFLQASAQLPRTPPLQNKGSAQNYLLLPKSHDPKTWGFLRAGLLP